MFVSVNAGKVLPNITNNLRAGNREGIPPVLNHDPKNAKQSTPPRGSRTDTFQPGQLAGWCRIIEYRVVPTDGLPVAQI
jgi:hypothetical protein